VLDGPGFGLPAQVRSTKVRSEANWKNTLLLVSDYKSGEVRKGKKKRVGRERAYFYEMGLTA
jgi:hypothetical protein